MGKFEWNVHVRWWLIIGLYIRGDCQIDDAAFLQASANIRSIAPLTEESTHIYGKYMTADGSFKYNSIVLSKPWQTRSAESVQPARVPVVVHLHGGAESCKNNEASTQKRAVDQYVARGFAFVFIYFRCAAEEYFYKDSDTDALQPEELIHIGNDGQLWLDAQGRTIGDYSVRAMYHELLTKADFDAVQALEYIIQHADRLGVDPHNIVFQGSSHGSQPAKYLTWIYHKFNIGRFTPKGLILDDSPISMPEALSTTFSVIASHVGSDFKFSDLMVQDICSLELGNRACSVDFPPNCCNQTWHDNTVSRYCQSPGYESATVGDLVASQAFLSDKKTCCDFSEGMEKIWAPSFDMNANEYTSFYLMACNPANCTQEHCFPHLSMFAREYAQQAALAGANFTAYYTDYNGMAQEGAGEKILVPAPKAYESRSSNRLGDWYNLGTGNISWNYRSSFDWRKHKLAEDTQICTHAEAAAFVEYVTVLQR